MADVQLENGWIMVATPLIEEWYRRKKSASQDSVFWCVIRNSYGWKRKDWPFMTAQLLAMDTGMPFETARKAIQSLRAAKVLNGRAIEKDFDLWTLPRWDSTQGRNLPPGSKPTPPRVETHPQDGLELTPPSEVLQKHHNIHEDNKLAGAAAVRAVFEAWNQEKIVVHKAIGTHEATIRARLKDYTVDELKAAIRNYSSVFHDPSKRFSYPWTLKDFLTRPRGLDRFIPDNFGTQRFAHSMPRGSISWAEAQDRIPKEMQDDVHRLTRWYQRQIGQAANRGWDGVAYETTFREAERWHTALGPLKRTAVFIEQAVNRLREREGFNASWLRREVAEWGAKHPAHGGR